jgi:hypothetical protein
MKTMHTLRFAAALGGALAVTALLTAFVSGASPKFYNDDPLWRDADTQDASQLKPLEVDLVADLAYNLVGAPGDQTNRRAMNVNTVDEVPDSNWYTNRAGMRPLTDVDVAAGPDTTAGPAAGPWTVIASKSDGVTPGFTIKDHAGQLWFLKFDPPGYRAMATGTEVAVTKLLWALGYFVPENHIAYLRRDQLVVGDGAKFTPPGGSRRTMRLSDLETLLAHADREGDGSYRTVASKALPGKPIGRIRFYDTRPDDPNDVVPHEHRRELRGYGVFAAWLNHVDAKAINSLDVLMTEHGRSFVRHHLLDFGSTLGSAGVAPADYWEGAEYLVQPREIAKQMLGFGFYIPKWRTTEFYEAPSIGRLPKDNTRFNPDPWKPRVPNQAFLHARADDKFWAAQKLAAISRDMLRAAVKTGEFGDPRAEEFLVNALAERRAAILRTYLTAVNPIAGPALDADGILTFRNAAVDADVARAPREYRALWSAFDNATGISRPVGETTGQTTRLEAPTGLPSMPGAYVRIEISSIGGMNAAWERPVDAYFRRLNGGWKLVGFERMPEHATAAARMLASAVTTGTK